MALIRQISTDSESPVDVNIAFDKCDQFLSDMVLNNGDVDTTSALYPAVLLSLFCDKLAPDDVQLDGEALNRRKGWWGDIYPKVENDLLGSHLWLLRRAKITNATLNQLRQACIDALAWLTIDKIAEDVKVSVQRDPDRIDSILIMTEILKPTGDITKFKFAYTWEAQGAS